MNGSPALEGWLNNATMGLSEEAKTYIQKQSLKRYEDAYQVELINGFTPEQAQNAAVLQFGNPLQANKEYKRKYLSTRQTKFLRHCLYTDTDWRINLSILVIWVLHGLFVWSQYRNNEIWIPVEYIIYVNLFLLCVFSFTVYYWLPACKQNNISIAHYLWISMFGYDLAFAAIMFSIVTHSSMLLGGFIMFFSMFFTYTFPKIILISKLRKENSYLEFI